MWVLRPRPLAEAQYRLFCFPYAGIGPSAYRSWVPALPGSIEARLVQLPGREGRWREAPLTNLEEIAPRVAAAIAPELDKPYAFYGHSLGALVAFEVARYFRRTGTPGPAHLFVAAHRGPHLPNPHPEMRQLTDNAFVAELRRRYDGIPQAVVDNPELLELMLPCLRADFHAYETYRYVSEPPLSCPISAFGGDRDLYVRPAEIAGWRDQTTARFKMRIVPANHFFLQTERDVLIGAIGEDLLQPAGAESVVAG